MPIFAGQITAPNPAIPGVLQNMFPMATSQVYLLLFVPALCFVWFGLY
jgi:hypothetical protein